jgi:hypothetical protein
MMVMKAEQQPGATPAALPPPHNFVISRVYVDVFRSRGLCGREERAKPTYKVAGGPHGVAWKVGHTMGPPGRPTGPP